MFYSFLGSICIAAIFTHAEDMESLSDNKRHIRSAKVNFNPCFPQMTKKKIMKRTSDLLQAILSLGKWRINNIKINYADLNQWQYKSIKSAATEDSLPVLPAAVKRGRPEGRKQVRELQASSHSQIQESL